MTHIIWDRDGCLVDSGKIVFDTYKLINEKLELSREDLLSSYDNFRLWNRTNWFDNYSIMNLPESSWETADKIFENNTKDSNPEFFPGIKEFINGNTYTHSVVTGNFEYAVKKHIDLHGLTSSFVDIAGYHQGLPVNKVQLVQKQMQHIDSDDIIMIGDTVDDGLAAQAVGARFIASGFGLTHPIRLKDELEFKGITPEFFAETPSDLCKYLNSRA